MNKLTIKFSTNSHALVPEPIKLKIPGWAGLPEKMKDGGSGQPWHCLPFSEGATYGLELVYPLKTECQVVNDQGHVNFEWDYAKEPGVALNGSEFLFFAPRSSPKFYMFNTGLDIQAPPGYVIRTEPHTRYFVDETETVPLAMISHLQNEWYPRKFFVVFRTPLPGRRHIFRMGEPYAQILFVPQTVKYELERMSPEEQAKRNELEIAVQNSRRALATNRWQNCDGSEMDNHYKILAASFARGGQAGVEATIQDAVNRQEQQLTGDQSLQDWLDLGTRLVSERKYQEGKDVFVKVLTLDPDNTDGLNQIGICLVCMGHIQPGLQTMAKAITLQPQNARYHSSIGEILRLLGRFPEAEAAFRSSLQISPNPGILSVLGQTVAQQGRLTEGVELCRRALSLDPSVAAIQFRMGSLLAQQGNVHDARTHFESALIFDPGFEEAKRALRELNTDGQLPKD